LAPGGLPGSSIARGALMTILGENLESAAVTITDARGRIHPVAALFASPGQINAVLPCGVAPGEARLSVGSSAESFVVVDQNFQLFTRNRRGFGPAVAENLGEEGPRLNSLTAPAVPGQAVALWGTGLGMCDGTAGRGVTVRIGGRVALVLARRRVEEIPGTERLVVLVPLRASPGCSVPVVVRSGGEFSNFASLSIGTGEECLDKLNGFSLAASKLRQGPLAWGRIQLLRGAATTERPGIVVLQTAAEQGEASFVRSTLDSLAEAAHYPSLGDCLVRPLGSSAPGGAVLDAGLLTLSGLWELVLAPDRLDGLYRRRLSPTPFENRSGDFLRPQTSYLVRGQGGGHVGRFEAVVTVPQFLQWTNREDLPFALDRSVPIELRWSGGEPGREFVVIRGFSFDRQLNRGREFVCTAPVEGRGFRLPESVVWSLPATPQDFFLSAGNAPLLVRPAFQASGLDLGFFTYEMAAGRNFALR
jgi:uncharacterized protein (TIGR03437 family)